MYQNPYKHDAYLVISIVIRMRENEMKPLAENELLILKSLEESPKGFEDLRKDQGLSRPVLSKHLKSLQKRGLVKRNPDTRKYEALQLPKNGEIDYAVWESTRLEDVRRAAKWVERILESGISDELKWDLLDRFLGASFQFMAANIALNMSEAIQKENPYEVQIAIKRLVDGYVSPFLRFLAMYLHNHREKVGKWLEIIGSSFSHEAKHEFDIEEILKALNTIEGKRR